MDDLKMRISIKTPSRLHLGIIDPTGVSGRVFGSVGVSINQPNVALETSPHEKLITSGPRARRVKILAEKFLKQYGIESGAKIHITEMIPEHVGLGSGTQLSLAVAMSLAKLFRLKVSINELAAAMERGSISGIGTAAFESGGFIIDGGHKSSEVSTKLKGRGAPPLIFRCPFPEDWRFVVALPKAKRGLTAEEERLAFHGLQHPPRESVDMICGLILTKMLPALVEEDIKGFGEALTEVQILVGENFSAAQGGRFSSPVVGKYIDFMLSQGVYGAGQSSWGPTVYGLINRDKGAEKIRDAVKDSLGGRVFIASPDNQGANVEVSEK
ncbi:MAG: kinase [Nitrososphaeria archaeon]|nr:kinase [Nitrososphaeria archaeon]NIN51593.1 kinase [Nitrososphaeria archaeon]NIQ32078.1 kinase [Nitrososphaeria archaeon]